MSVRVATLTDTTPLVRVINRAYMVEAHIFAGERTDEPEIHERLTRPNACFFVIDDDPEVGPGLLAGAVYVETRGTRGYFGMLSVDPDRQGRGFGRQLVAAAEAYCNSAGCEFMDIDVVDQRPELPGYYAALGYSTLGATPFPHVRCKVPVQMIHMAKAL